LEKVKHFKTSWIDLGQALYSVWKDKLYRQWGFNQFDTYTAKEIGIKKPTAMKLLKSYYFLEKEEPEYLKKSVEGEPEDAGSIPSMEAVDLLRSAKNKKTLGESEYADLKKDVFEKNRDVKEIKKDLTGLMRQREELDPEEAREKHRDRSLRRFLGALRAVKHEIETAKLLPVSIIKEADTLIRKIEHELAV
ncbi:MAG: hypothetical protein PHC33_06310, partial [Candidatus Omnitrophica bacterium]|nr:hypothetical protein [Candidatus Omnitrophota bacterium]